MQPKSSNASVFFFLFETPVEINTWLLSFHQMHHRSRSSSSPQTSLLSEKKSCNCYMSSLSIELSAVSVMSQRVIVLSELVISPHCVLQLTSSVHFIEVQRMSVYAKVYIFHRTIGLVRFYI